jgi:single-stranded-DNA-specific exonuclease
MLYEIENFAKDFLETTNDKKEILIISHFDTDGITSASILGLCLKELNKKFSFKIVKRLEKDFFKTLPKTKTIIFLDLASSMLKEISEMPNNVFIVDHHEIDTEFQTPNHLKILNHHLFHSGEEMSGSCLTYLFTKALTKSPNIQRANLGIVGLVGDIGEKNIGPLTNTIIKDSGISLKKGVLLYPSTRPLNKTLEYCSNPYIPGITGDNQGANELLREAGITFTKQGYKSLIELNEDEMKRLVTAIALRIPDPEKMSEFVGNLFLVKFFNQQEDARELSALINACSRMGHPNTALLMCMGNHTARRQAVKIHIKYRQSIVQALKHVDTQEKIQGDKYVIMNAKDQIENTIIGTIASIVSMSAIYKEGTIIVAMAYDQDKIKVSSRISGRGKKDNTRNLKEIMDEVTDLVGGEAGGHKMAAGCLISKEKEEAFIDVVKKKLDLDVVKI